MLVSGCTCSRVRDYLGTHLVAAGEFSGTSDSCNLIVHVHTCVRHARTCAHAYNHPRVWNVPASAHVCVCVIVCMVIMSL